MLSTKELERLLIELMEETVNDLLQRVRSGSLETRDYSVVIKFLKDNNISLETLLLAEPPAKEDLQSRVPWGSPEVRDAACG